MNGQCACEVCERGRRTPRVLLTCACVECLCAVQVPAYICSDCSDSRHSKASVMLASGGYLNRDGKPCDSRGNPLSTLDEGGAF